MVVTSIDHRSLTRVLGAQCPQLMVYGFADCHWGRVTKEIRANPDGPIKKVFDCSLGFEDREETTLEGCVIHKFPTNDTRFKSALVNLVFENFKREKVGLPLIPILFLIDNLWDTSPFYPPSPKEIINNRNVATLQELRRAYKLCEDSSLPKKIRDVAKKTFKFVQVQTRTPTAMEIFFRTIAVSLGLIVRYEPVFYTYSFNKIETPWQGRAKKAWDTEWTRYHAEKTLTPKKEEHISRKTKTGKLWRSQLIVAQAAFKRQFPLL